MKRRIVLFITVIMSLLSLIVVHAQDSEATPEPGSRADNECYSGGTMAGRCDNGFHADGSTTPDEIAWAWRCGWYMARFNDGSIGRGDVPSDCESLMPGLPPVTDITPSRICKLDFQSPTFTIQYCIQGSDLFEVVDSIFKGKPFHNENRMHWIITDANVGSGGKCSPHFNNDLGSFNFSAMQIWAQNIWLNAGFKATDDVCVFT